LIAFVMLAERPSVIVHPSFFLVCAATYFSTQRIPIGGWKWPSGSS
jgi:hypothetical protein